MKESFDLSAGNVNECAHWTKWFDNDSPSGTSEKETLHDFVWQRDGFPVETCRYPIGTQGRIKNTHQTVTTQIVTVTLDGLICINENQVVGKCLDFEVRFCCLSKFEIIF